MNITLILGKDLQSLLIDPAGHTISVDNGTLFVPMLQRIIHYPELCLHPQKIHLTLFGKIRKFRNFDLVIISNSKEVFDYLLYSVSNSSSNPKSIFFNSKLSIKIIDDNNSHFTYSEQLDDFGFSHVFPNDFWTVNTSKYRF